MKILVVILAVLLAVCIVACAPGAASACSGEHIVTRVDMVDNSAKNVRSFEIPAENADMCT